MVKEYSVGYLVFYLRYSWPHYRGYLRCTIPHDGVSIKVFYTHCYWHPRSDLVTPLDGNINKASDCSSNKVFNDKPVSAIYIPSYSINVVLATKVFRSFHAKKRGTRL